MAIYTKPPVQIELSAYKLCEIASGLYHLKGKAVVVTKDSYEEMFQTLYMLNNQQKSGIVNEIGAIKMFERAGGVYARTHMDKYLWGAALVADSALARMGMRFF